MKNQANKRYWLASKRHRWGLTIWGWLLILLIIFLLGWLLFTRLYGFLAPMRPVQTDILIVEGSVPDYILDEAKKEYEEKGYKLLITSGTPLEWGHMLMQYSNTANIAAESLKKKGFDSTALVAVSTEQVLKDRTYHTGLEVAEYLHKHRPEARSVNLMSYGPHALRSQMMYQAALGDSIRVGIISKPSIYYNADNWWKTSKGFREVLNEFFAYVFVKLFFTPYPKEESQESNLKSQVSRFKYNDE